MDEKLKRFFEPWELKILELIEVSRKDSEKPKDVVEKVANQNSNADNSKP